MQVEQDRVQQELREAKAIIQEMDLIIRDATEATGNEPFWYKYQKEIYPRVEALGL